VTALEGIRVIDLTRLLPGAVATQWLADFGAEVIKVEQPGLGDYARHKFTGDGENPIFALTNRGKKSVTIDLKDPAGRDALIKLSESADVLIEGFRPGVMERLGVGYDALRGRNPRLIYAALTGYGTSGKFVDLAGHDINYLALSGVLDLMGERHGPPSLAGIQIADLAGGSMQAVIGILLALQARERTGRGQRVDVSMFAGSAALMPVPLAVHSKKGMLRSEGTKCCAADSPAITFTRGQWIYVAVGRARAQVLGKPVPRTRLRGFDRRPVCPRTAPVRAETRARREVSLPRPPKSGSENSARRTVASRLCER
jgi:crotonobetainyl-CoA:carnitine CoA-transferase CaiB-like acyl-CoA transferase